MEDKDILYTTVDEQIHKLQTQGLIIDDPVFAREELQRYGYSNLIKSYREPYIYMENNQKFYRSGVTFEQIHSLYILDKNLRNAVMASMLDLEEYIKEAAADVIAAAFGIHQDEYLKFRNYSNKKKHKYRFSLPGILDTLKKALETDKDPIFHYLNKYGTVPPWILFKGIYFSTIINFINLFKPSEQEALVHKLYTTKHSNTDYEGLSAFMLDTLFICLEYRNLAAHGGRIYNYNNKSGLRLPQSESIKLHGFSRLLFLLRTINYPAPYDTLTNALTEQINNHCKLFPEDVTYLGQILNIDIIPQKIVWVTEHGTAYHKDRHCSGIKNPTEMECSEAEAQGIKPCKRCCK